MQFVTLRFSSFSSLVRMWNIKLCVSCKFLILLKNICEILLFFTTSKVLKQIEKCFHNEVKSECRKFIRSGIASEKRIGWLEASKQPAWAHQAVVNRRTVWMISNNHKFSVYWRKVFKDVDDYSDSSSSLQAEILHKTKILSKD